MSQDIRWKHRFSNYLKALQTLDEAYALTQTRALSRLEQQGLIQSFEFTHEPAWNGQWESRVGRLESAIPDTRQ